MVDQRFTGYLVVFDDISDVISASRTVAWGGGASTRHEIKNPLTPDYGYRYERLAMKLEDKSDDKMPLC